MHPINLVLGTPARPLPDRPSTAGLGEVGPLVRVGPVPDFGGVQLRFRLRGAAAQRVWESSSAHGE